LTGVEDDCLVEELEHFGEEGVELGVSVAVLHAEHDLRVRLNQTRSELAQVVEHVRVILELGVLHADFGRLLQQVQEVDHVELAEALRGVAADAGNRLNGRQLGVLFALVVAEDVEHVGDE